VAEEKTMSNDDTPFMQALLGSEPLNVSQLRQKAMAEAIAFGKQPPAEDEGRAAPYAAAVRAAVAALGARAADNYESALARGAIVPLYLAYLQATIVGDLPKRSSFGWLALGLLGGNLASPPPREVEPILHL
jgi:hypothetical protein